MIKSKGVALILSVIILTAVLAIALTAGKVFTDKIKMSRNTSDSMKAYYAAESGIEYALYQIKKSLPVEHLCPNWEPIDGAFYCLKQEGDSIKAIGKAREASRGIEVEVAQAAVSPEQEKWHTVAYKPSDDVLYIDSSMVRQNDVAPKKLKEITLHNIYPSMFRIKLEGCQSAKNGNPVYLQVYKNGSPYGAECVIVSTDCSSPATCTEDLSFNATDKIAIYGSKAHSSNPQYLQLNSFSINGTLDGDGHFWYPYSR